MRAGLRWAVGITVAYAAAAASQWQIDSLWGASGFSARVLYVPVLMLIAVPVALLALFSIISVFNTVTSFDPDLDDLGTIGFLAGLVIVASAFMTLIVYLTAVVFDYPWQQASAIVTVEPIAWIVVLALVLARPAPHRPARDPCLQLVADLAGFLAITAIPVHQVDREDTDRRLTFSDHPTHWNDAAYSISNDDRLGIASRNWSRRKRQNKWEKRARKEFQARSQESDQVSPESEQAGGDAPFESTPNQGWVSIDPSIVDDDDPASVEYQRLLEEIRSAFEDWQWELAREVSSDESGDTPYDPLPEVMRISSDVWRWHSDHDMRRVLPKVLTWPLSASNATSLKSSHAGKFHCSRLCVTRPRGSGRRCARTPSN